MNLDYMGRIKGARKSAYSIRYWNWNIFYSASYSALPSISKGYIAHEGNSMKNKALHKICTVFKAFRYLWKVEAIREISYLWKRLDDMY